MTTLNKIIQYTLSYLGEDNKDVLQNKALEIEQSYKLHVQNKIEKEVSKWIDQWVALFPSDITTGGIPVQSSPDKCYDKMVKFLKRTKYTKDIIFTATENYLEDRALNNFAYTKAAQYFIDKRGEGSLLEDWCRKVQTGEVDELLQESNQFNEFI